MMSLSLRGGLLGFATTVCLVPIADLQSTADAQSRNHNRWYGRSYSLHGPGFGRGEGGIYSGTRDYGHNHHGHHHPGYATPYVSPYVYTPYAAPPYPYDPSFVPPGYYGGFVDPYSPYNFPAVGYGQGYVGINVYGPGPVIDVPGPAAIPLPVENPVEYHVANSKAEADRLRAMMRNQDPDALPLPEVAPVIRPSTSDQQLAGLRDEQAGDRDFAAGRYLLAYTHYKNSIDKAGDRTEPRLKLVVTLATIGQYPRATDALRTLLQLDPAYPQHFIPLDSLYGDSQITKEAVKTQVARWALEHVANPERLMLLGALMYFDGDIAKSRQLFENVVIYDDLAPLVRGFLVDGAIDGNAGEPTPAGPIGPLEIPKADIPPDFIPNRADEPVQLPNTDGGLIAPPLPQP